jgi:hypothetical protein
MLLFLRGIGASAECSESYANMGLNVFRVFFVSVSSRDRHHVNFTKPAPKGA